MTCKGVEKLLGDAKKVTDSVVKTKAPTASPKAVRKQIHRPAAKPAKLPPSRRTWSPSSAISSTG
jgi:hypothetical protein